jgi:hypothetical protein
MEDGMHDDGFLLTNVTELGFNCILLSTLQARNENFFF